MIRILGIVRSCPGGDGIRAESAALEKRFSFQEGDEASGAANCSQEAPDVFDRPKLGSGRRKPLTFIPDAIVSNKGLLSAGVV